MLPDAFTAKTLVMPTPCIIWTGALNSNGYGRFSVDCVSQLAHRVAYQHAHGPIPEGLTIDHLCRVKRCVNPDHLEAVTGIENTRRAAQQDRPTECAKGHPYTPENTGTKRRAGGGQQMFCKTCQAAATKAWRQKAVAPGPALGMCGTTTNYRRGCRCDLCREAKRTQRRAAV